jgi:hypothetical protein
MQHGASKLCGDANDAGVDFQVSRKSVMPRTIVIARLNHETNTFSPVPTPLEAFAPLWNEAAYQDQKGARTSMGAFLDIVEALPDVVIVTPVAAMANPSGTVQSEAYRAACDAILKAVEAGCDAIPSAKLAADASAAYMLGPVSFGMAHGVRSCYEPHELRCANLLASPRFTYLPGLAFYHQNGSGRWVITTRSKQCTQ